MTLTLRERIMSLLQSSSSSSSSSSSNRGKKNIVLGLDYIQYEKLVRIPTQDIFVLFDTRYTEFAEFFLDQGRMRKRGDETVTPAQVLKGIRLYHVRLRERLDAIYYFRSQHEKLRGVVAEVLTGGGAGGGGGKTIGTTSLLGSDGEDYSTWALKEVDDAPVSLFASLDVLDLSTRGEAMFTNALEGYDRKVDAIEEHLARLLRDKLSSCQVSDCLFILLTHIRSSPSSNNLHFVLYITFPSNHLLGCRGHVPCIRTFQPTAITIPCAYSREGVPAPANQYSRFGRAEAPIEVYAQV
jgi:dynein heavy chain 1